MSAPEFPRQFDGNPRTERELTVRPKIERPFKNAPIPDIYARIYRRKYAVGAGWHVPRIAVRTAWTNLLTYSQAFDNAAWTKTNATATAAAGIAPDGTVTMASLLETVTNGEHSATQAGSPTAAAHVLSVFALPLGRSYLRLAFTDSATTVFSAFFDVTRGRVFSQSAGVAATIQKQPDGQFRCSMLFTPAAGAGTVKLNTSTDGTTISYAGDIAKGLYLWGAEMKAGSVAGPYVPTTGTTATISAPDTDADDPLAYLVEETDPEPTPGTDFETFWRTYARVPGTQTVPSTLSITKPTPAAYATALNMRLVTGSGTYSDTGVGGYEYTNFLWDTIYSRIYGAIAATTSADSGGNERVTWTGHGLAGTERIAVYATLPGSAAWHLFAPGQYTVVDANTIDLTGWSTITSASSCAKYSRDYTPGLDDVACNVVSTFSLAGVSAALAIPSPLLNDIAFLAAVISTPSGYLDYQTKNMGPWLGAISQLDTVRINMADV